VRRARSARARALDRLPLAARPRTTLAPSLARTRARARAGTTAAAAFAPSAKPMQQRVLFENAGVASAIATRLHQRLYD